MKITLLLVLATLVPYAGLLLAQDLEFGYDDSRFISENPAIRDLGNAPSFFGDPRTVDPDGWAGIYRPLRTLDFALDWAVAGDADAPVGFLRWLHLRNIIYHVVSTLLLFALFSRWGAGRGGAFLGALVFALHPVQAEAVGWITSRGDCLFLVFFLGALLLHDRSRGRDASFFGAAAFLVLSLLAKEAALVFPAAAFISDWCFGGRGVARSRWWKYVAYLIPCALYVVLWFGLHSKYGGDVAHTAAPWGGSRTGSALMFCRGLVYYARLILLPVDMAHDFYLAPTGSPNILTALCLAAVVAVTAAALIRAWRGKSTGSFAILWFLIAISPVSHVVLPVGIPTAERFLYLPMVGVALWAGKWLERARRSGPAGWVLVVTTVLCLTAVTFERAQVWRSAGALWSSANERFFSPRAGVWLADELRVEAEEWVREEQRLEQAHRYGDAADARRRARPGLERALGLYRRSAGFWDDLAEPDPAGRERANMAIALADMGRVDEALGRVAGVIDKYPAYARGHYARALAEYAGYREASRREYAAAVVFAGWLPMAAADLSGLLDFDGMSRLRRARDGVEAALARSSDVRFRNLGAAVHKSLATHYRRPHRGNDPQASHALRRSWELMPDEEKNRGVRTALNLLDRSFRAGLADLEARLSRSPNDAHIHLESAVHHARHGYIADSDRIFASLTADPGIRRLPKVLFYHAFYYWQWRDTVEGFQNAAAEYEELLRLPPRERGSYEIEARRQLRRCRAELSTRGEDR